MEMGAPHSFLISLFSCRSRHKKRDRILELNHLLDRENFGLDCVMIIKDS